MRRLQIAIVINLVFCAIEATAGGFAKSTALLADAAHNLSDVLGLLLAFGAVKLALRPATERRTYGYKRSTILAGLTNALLIFAAVGGVFWESITRMGAPPEVRGWIVVVTAAIGLLVNGGSALVLARGSKDDTNLRGAYLHLLADALVSVAVIAGGVLVMVTKINVIDPVLSALVSLFIAVSTWRLLRDSLGLALDEVPPRVDATAVRAYLEKIAGVENVHDLHIWPVSTTEVALTVHLVVTAPGSTSLVGEIEHELRRSYAIDHVTVQVEAAAADRHCHGCA